MQVNHKDLRKSVHRTIESAGKSMHFLQRKRSEKGADNRSIVASLAKLLGNDLITVVEFGSEPSLKKLTNTGPSLFVVMADGAAGRFLDLQSLYPIENGSVLFAMTETEAALLPILYPLDLIHIRSGYSLLYGEERLLHVEITRDAVTTQIIHDILSLKFQIRALCVSNSGNGNHCGINILRRMMTIIKGLLSLRQTTIPVDWASMVSDLESSYNLKEFPLSGMIASLEKKSSASLDHFFPSLLAVLEDLRLQLFHSDGSVA